MNNFRGQNLPEFSEHFKTDLDCKKYLSEIKWKDGFKCVKCGLESCQVRETFFICFEMSPSTKSLSARYTAAGYGVTEKTASLFMHNVREAMKSSERYPMDGIAHVDEFVLGGVEQGKIGCSCHAKKKKAVTALHLRKEGKLGRMYAMGIEDFSARSLESIFTNHISKSAQVTTDKLLFLVTRWKGYRPIATAYNITQIERNKRLNFVALHMMNHQIKSWIHTTYSWVSDFNLNKYFDEFCFIVNRSQSKEAIFNNLITKTVNKEKIYQKNLICA